MVYLGEMAEVEAGMMGKSQVSTPPEAYILYKQLEAWDWHHLPGPGAFCDQAYLIMMQIRVVGTAIARFETSRRAAEESRRNATTGVFR